MSERSPANRPTVIQVAREIGPGKGVAGVVFALSEALERMGYDVIRLTISETRLGGLRRDGSMLASKLRLLRDVLWFSFAGAQLARRTKKDNPGSVVISHGDALFGDIYVNHGLLKVALSRRSRPLLAAARNPMHWFTLARDHYRYGAHSPHDRIVTLSAADAILLREHYPRLRAETVTIPNGVDLEKFAAQGVTSIRGELGIPESAFTIVFVGHEFERKGLHHLLGALQLLPEFVHVLVVGGDDTNIRDASRGLTAEASARIHFVGTVADPRPFFASADAFCLASDYEAAPLVLLEALAMGLPVFVSRVGPAEEMIIDGQNGYFVERSAESIASRVFMLASQGRGSEEWESVHRASLETARAYGWDSIADRYARLIDLASSHV